uniref:Uncharacterized protein n=1 Tax=Romanomermis culicivorax TaxID=13658 RepID=A0A915IBK6_ROMCU
MIIGTDITYISVKKDPDPSKSTEKFGEKYPSSAKHIRLLRVIYAFLFRWSRTDRQQLEMFSLKIHFRPKRITAIWLKTTEERCADFRHRCHYLFEFGSSPGMFIAISKNKIPGFFPVFPVVGPNFRTTAATAMAKQLRDCLAKKVLKGFVE